MKKILANIKKAVKNAKTALIVSHIDPDGDSIGSMLAMGNILTQFNLTTFYYSEDGLPKVYRFLPGADKVVNKLPPFQRYDLLFTMDASDIKRLGSKLSVKEIAKIIINIDHHPDNTKYGNFNYIEKCSSTAELVFKIAKHWDIKINRETAENLYIALITDTGNFRYENTSAKTFTMAAELLKTGIDTHEISTRIYDTRSIASIRIQAAALVNVEISPDRKAAWTVVTEAMMQKHQARGEDLMGLVDQIRSIEGIEVAMLFREEKSKVKVNFRSKNKVNVSALAKRFGGGGHIRAAGAVMLGSIDNVKNDIVAEVLKYLKASKYLA
ncbi:hypothetical protein A3H38_04045 [candidate division WOR-1 bacterium RIFCSPLOWO2_02_FULL_46_20]|uniref:DDH domain-containing protein n=1 Tax=candidate division WOR-1 bacterium RIFCSPLOWO2_02_FULL_46_20 TaxID=1802567 RepID=A0A1F4RDB9_UNCSA|nr:MAG: hypothetical protein A3H38_04045 [candidate division WOR-1 bacterium RIFCSPLOWO2_02_FULL_46_20]